MNENTLQDLSQRKTRLASHFSGHPSKPCTSLYDSMSTLTTKITSVLAVALLFSCSPNLYKTTELLPDSKGRQKKYILLNYETMGFYNTAMFVDLLNKRSWKKLEAKLQYVEDEHARYFIQAVALIMQADYDAAYLVLKDVPDHAFACQAGMLKTDCMVELGNTSVDHRYSYQTIMDCTHRPDIKQIVNTRFRFLKYD